ncbi:MAG: arylesterase [Gammaproteobacteria bacterium]|nr:arylesterase [Gammaproteobacteria bacterium]
MLRLLLLAGSFLIISAVLPHERTILVLGDSLSAGYGISVDRGWVSLLQERLEEKGYRYRVLNASISGDTSSGARARLNGLLKDGPPDISVVELGGNDGLRGISLEELGRNLDDIVGRLLDAGSRVLLLPMKLPPNYGPVYTQGFERLYRDLAAEHDVVVGAFILKDIVLNAELMQDDGIHPRAEAQPIILDRVWSVLEPMLQDD